MTPGAGRDDSRARFYPVLVIAVLLHVMALALVPGPTATPLPQTTINVQLIPPPAPSPSPLSPSTISSSTSSRPASYQSSTAAVAAAPAAAFPEVKPVPEQHSLPPTESADTVTTEDAKPPAAASPSAPAEPAVAATTPAPSDEVRQESTVKQPLLSPYELEIRRYIAREVRYEKSLAELRQPRQLILELQLMANGTLERVRIAHSSGDERLDRLARQAALMASPFPAVPVNQKNRHFQLELRFNPDDRG